MSSPAEQQPQTPGSPGAVLAGVRAAKAREVAASAEILIGAYEWATMHEHPADEGGLEVSVYGNPVPVAGEGCPGVGEFAVAELAAALGVTTDAGKVLIGHAVELAHRLPKLWQQVVDGEVEAWRARRVADHTIVLSREAAGFVDKHTAAVAGKVGPVQLDRIILAARKHHMPDTLESEHDPDSARDRRGFWVHDQQVSYDGVIPVSGNLELPDALDLDQAIGAVAAQLRLAGSVESLDARRALALGELARTQLALTLEPADPADPNATAPVARPGPARSVTLYVHLSEASVTGTGVSGVGRCENTRTPLDPATVRQWCGAAGATVTVKPVIDLADQVGVWHYEVPARIKEAGGSQGRPVCVPVVCPPGPALRRRPRDPPCRGREHVLVQHRAAVSTSPPVEDVDGVALQDARTRRLPMDLTARLPVPPRPFGHPRCDPARARAPTRLPPRHWVCGRRPARPVATPPRTPPDVTTAGPPACLNGTSRRTDCALS